MTAGRSRTNGGAQQPRPLEPDESQIQHHPHHAGVCPTRSRPGRPPGVWVRPLQAYPGQPRSWRLARDRDCLDPSVPEVRAYVRETIRRLQGWGFELIKHDYSTEEIAGRWGFEMKGEMIADGWAFADRSRTTAEVILDLYRDIRQAAGKDTLVLGCNTVGHLAAGLFELQRIGDDTSGKDWSRTRKMGVNSLAFRAPQHGTFFAVDGDCAGQVSRPIPSPGKRTVNGSNCWRGAAPRCLSLFRARRFARSRKRHYAPRWPPPPGNCRWANHWTGRCNALRRAGVWRGGRGIFPGREPSRWSFR